MILYLCMYVVIVHFIVVSFYRTTLCVSAVFASARCLSVCPSVCLSVTLVYCTHMTDDIVELLLRPGSPIILLFRPQRRYQIPRKPLQRGKKIHGVGKSCVFPLKSQFVSETVRHRPLVAMKR